MSRSSVFLVSPGHKSFFLHDISCFYYMKAYCMCKFRRGFRCKEGLEQIPSAEKSDKSKTRQKIHLKQIAARKEYLLSQRTKVRPFELLCFLSPGFLSPDLLPFGAILGYRERACTCKKLDRQCFEEA